MMKFLMSTLLLLSVHQVQAASSYTCEAVVINLDTAERVIVKSVNLTVGLLTSANLSVSASSSEFPDAKFFFSLTTVKPDSDTQDFTLWYVKNGKDVTDKDLPYSDPDSLFTTTPIDEPFFSGGAMVKHLALQYSCKINIKK